jgi:MoaA/NifB/PqqE/SkfB family radical SAM enzyme
MQTDNQTSLVNNYREWKKQLFHKRHEIFTKLAYRFPGILPDRYCFVLTNMCNLRCKNCYQEKKYKSGSMNKDDWIALTRQLPSYARVTLVGGEPLVFPGFEEVFRYVAARHLCNVITNGILLDNRKADLFLSFPKFRVLAVSLDDMPNSTIGLRNITKLQWNRMVKALHYFVEQRNKRRSSCVLEVKTLMLDENAERLFELHKYCVEELGCDHHTFQFLKGSPLQHSDRLFDFNDIYAKSHAQVCKKFSTIRSQLEKIRNYNVKNHAKAFLHPKIADLNSENPLPDISIINQNEHRKELYQPCKFPWSSVHINYDGTLFPCLAIPMGNVKEHSLREIMRGATQKRFLQIIKTSGTVEACNRCGWLRPKARE